MRYLVTPEAKQYLEQIEILEVTERHECNQIKVIHTKKVKIEMVGFRPTTLFEIMYEMKNSLGCRFEF